MADDMVVANTILEQLGGRRLIVMTGARNFVGGGDFLSFSLPRAKDGINRIKVTLTGRDDYTLEAFRLIRGRNIVAKGQLEGIYADQLRGAFERMTGLYTSL